jgi:iron complex outermembrane receptor protein
MAQDGTSADPWSGVEEMIVTSTGGAAMLLEAPTSVAAFDAEYLDAIGAQNIGDIAEFTPNLEITSPFAASNPQLFIRGVGLQDSQSNAASAVAVVNDGVYMSSAAGSLSQLFDVQNLEVLRGPQGALYGRNASAGAIRITSNPPVHEMDSGFNVSYGRFNHLNLDGFVNVPIVQDVLAARFAFKFEKRDHLGENRCARFRDIDDAPTGGLLTTGGTLCYKGLTVQPQSRRPSNPPLATPPSNTNNRDNWAGRTLWLFDPTEELKFIFNFHGGQNFGKAPSFQNRGLSTVLIGLTEVPGLTTDDQNYLDIDTCTKFQRRNPAVCAKNDSRPGKGSPYSGDYSRVGDERLTSLGANLRTNWSRGPWSFEGVLAWEYNDREAVLDIDSSPFVAAETLYEDTSDEYFGDARLTWDDDLGVSIMLGATGLYDRLGALNTIWINPSSYLFQNITQKTYYFALFGYLDFEITENISISGGARINYERKSFELSSAVFRNQPFEIPTQTTTGALFNERALSEDFRPSGEVILSYEPTSDLMFYWKFSRGYKGRHFNGTAIDGNAPIDPVSPEFVNSFELGWNMNLNLGDVGISWNGAGYFYDYENQQVFQLQDGEKGGSFPVNQLINAEDSRLIGGETDVRIQWEGFELFQSIGVAYSEFSDFRNTTFRTVCAPTGLSCKKIPNVEDFSGNLLVNSPELSYVSYGLYRWEIPRIGTITPRLDWRYKSRVFYTPENDSRIGSEPRWLLDARVSYSNAEGTFEIAGWVRNLTDELYPVTAFDRKDGNGVIAYVISDPRTYGLTASFQF